MAILDQAAVEQVLTRARRVTAGRVLMSVLLGIGVAVGWPAGRFLTAIGWMAGRIWLTGAFFVEAVIYGFRTGAKLPLKAPESQ